MKFYKTGEVGEFFSSPGRGSNPVRPHPNFFTTLEAFPTIAEPNNF